MQFTACLLSLSLCACTTLQPMATTSTQAREYSQSLSQSVDKGDFVRVNTADGRSHSLRITQAGPDALEGQPAGGTAISLRYDQITSIEKEVFSMWKTGLLVLAIVYIAGIAALKSGGAVGFPPPP